MPVRESLKRVANQSKMSTTTEQSGTAETSVRGTVERPSAASVRRSNARNALPTIVVDQETENGPQSWKQALKHWLTGPEGVSLCASMAVHAMLFLIVGVVLYLLGLTLESDHGQDGTINAFFTEKNVDEVPDLELLTDLEFDLPTDGARSFAALLSSSSDSDSLFVPEAVLDDIGSKAALLPSLPENSMDLLSKAGGDSGKSWRKGGFAMPVDKGEVITRGSFSVWTVPKDPVPEKSYMIVIQLNRRVNIRNLKQDITGKVKGTDGYATGIGSSLKKGDVARQFVIPKARQIVIHIPGAAQLVKDVIEVHSKKLNETQNIELVF